VVAGGYLVLHVDTYKAMRKYGGAAAQERRREMRRERQRKPKRWR